MQLCNLKTIILFTTLAASCVAPSLTKPVAIAPSPAPAQTATGMPTAKRPVEQATLTPKPLQITNVTEAPATLPLLENSDPSDEEISLYLESNLGILLPDEWDERIYGRAGRIVREDVNGDELIDIVIDGVDYVVVMLRQEDDYSIALFKEASTYVRCCSSLIVALKDWTNDYVPEVVYDEIMPGGGPGFWTYSIVRSIVRCGRSCATVWQGEISSTVLDDLCGGEAGHRAQMELVTQPEGQLILKVLEQGFSAFVCYDSDEPVDHTVLRIDESALSWFYWDGKSFVRSSEEIVSLQRVVNDEQQLTAVSDLGLTAAIEWRSVPTADNQNDACRVNLQGKVISNWFGCKHDFVVVRWQDITGDGVSEIIVSALSGRYGYSPEESGEAIVDEPCFHRRFIAFQVVALAAAEIVNTAGCLSIENLDGVRLDDFDNDGLLDILSSGQSTIRVYKWNGTRFVFWAEAPGE